MYDLEFELGIARLRREFYKQSEVKQENIKRSWASFTSWAKGILGRVWDSIKAGMRAFWETLTGRR